MAGRPPPGKEWARRVLKEARKKVRLSDKTFFSLVNQRRIPGVETIQIGTQRMRAIPVERIPEAVQQAVHLAQTEGPKQPSFLGPKKASAMLRSQNVRGTPRDLRSFVEALKQAGRPLEKTGVWKRESKREPFVFSPLGIRRYKQWAAKTQQRITAGELVPLHSVVSRGTRAHRKVFQSKTFPKTFFRGEVFIERRNVGRAQSRSWTLAVARQQGRGALSLNEVVRRASEQGIEINPGTLKIGINRGRIKSGVVAVRSGKAAHHFVKPGSLQKFIAEAPKKAVLPSGATTIPAFLKDLERIGIPVSKPGLRFWLATQFKRGSEAIPEIEGIAQDRLDPKHRMFLSPAAQASARNWAASQYLANSLTNVEALIPLADFARRHNTAASRLHHLAKDAIVVIGREAYVTPSLAARLEQFMIHGRRGRAFVPPASHDQNQSVTEKWLEKLPASPERKAGMRQQLTAHLHESTDVFLKKTLPTMAIELAEEIGSSNVFARRIRIPMAERGIVPEGLTPEENVLKRFRAINSNITLEQAKDFVLKQMRKPQNRELFEGSHSETYGRRRLIIPIRAANKMAELFEQEETQRKKQATERQALTIENLDSRYTVNIMRARLIILLRTRPNYIRSDELATFAGITEQTVQRLVENRLLRKSNSQITVASIKKFFGLR